MVGSVLASVFFVLACLAALSGFYLVKKSVQRLAGLSWIVAGVIGLTCWHALVAAVINLALVPVNLWTVGASDVVLAAVLWFQVRRTRDIQQYEYHAGDLIVTAGLAGFATLFFALHTGGLRFDLHYATIDPAPRLMEAVDVVTTHSVQSMFFHALTNGLLMGIVGPATTIDHYYRIFVFSDGLFLVLAGLMFYATIRRFLGSKWLIAVGILVTGLYLTAYPLNGVLYGFIYLSMGVIIICYLAFVADTLMRDELDLWPAAGLLTLGCLGLILCYSMFVPVVFLAVIAMLLVKQARAQSVFSRETVLLCLVVFLPAVVLGLIYSYAGIFTGGVTVGSAFSTEGACYRDLYSTFLPFAPIAVFGLLKSARTKTILFPSVLLPLSAFFAIGLFAMGLLGKVSSYYFYKSYSLIWFALAYLVVVGITRIASRETAALFSLYAATWAVVFALAVSGVDYKMSQRYPLFNPASKSDSINEIFVWNKITLHDPGVMAPDKMELFHYVYDHYVAQGAPPVPYVGAWQDAFWYQAISNQRDSTWVSNAYDNPQAVLDTMTNSPSHYVLVLTEPSPGYDGNQAYLEGLPKVFENTAGFVAQLR